MFTCEAFPNFVDLNVQAISSSVEFRMVEFRIPGMNLFRTQWT